MVFRDCENSEQVMWCPCTGALCCKTGRWTGVTDEPEHRSVAAVLLRTCGLIKVVWLRMVLAGQNHRQVGMGEHRGCFCLFQGFCWHLHTSGLPLVSRRVAKMVM